MKAFLKILSSLVILFVLGACSSVQVTTDYDQKVNFDQYQSFAFYKPGIDQAKISDLDKRRILKAIEKELTAKGLQKKKNADLLISIFTKTKENVNIYQNNLGYGWGFSPFYGGHWQNTVSRETEGTLFIDLVDRESMELVWQGIGEGSLSKDRETKIERIQEIVHEILKKYPPEK
ncbi:DUF4136 domain-containing protein [Mesonia sp. HuA40]|uniref:DUF4136 domain-containing protein n=1 Tax=Mesonia sp. HuA40 TaxID=2602761 RepID=UPI0011CC028B|nr:DUF4136 domain-containing protein [Mesonia sp. HuA40]TXK73979.1 DUF4136 domain-containing protein [Mesonia sp. HuA40]